MTDQASRAAEIATIQGALTGGDMKLLGTMGTTKDPYALLRIGRRVLRVRPGDRAGKSRVLAIEPGRVRIDRGGLSTSLTVAGSLSKS